MYNVVLLRSLLTLNIHETCVYTSVQSHKDKIRQKEHHKKASDGLGSSVASSNIEKV